MPQYTVLVCDDEPHILHVVSTKLRNAGFEVLTAADGEEAFNLAAECRPDLVVTDYQMPMLSGLELCAKMRSEPATSGTPVIMLTARGFSMSEADLKNTNVRKILPKPFSPRELLRAAQEILEAAVPTQTGVVEGD
jgi:DNA-binding response OmpR family regulator